MQNLWQTLSVGSQTLQDAQAGDTTHSLWEIVEYASSTITLYPGDVISNGTSGGTAAGSAQTPPATVICDQERSSKHHRRDLNIQDASSG